MVLLHGGTLNWDTTICSRTQAWCAISGGYKIPRCHDGNRSTRHRTWLFAVVIMLSRRVFICVVANRYPIPVYMDYRFSVKHNPTFNARIFMGMIRMMMNLHSDIDNPCLPAWKSLLKLTQQTVKRHSQQEQRRLPRRQHPHLREFHLSLEAISIICLRIIK